MLYKTAMNRLEYNGYFGLHYREQLGFIATG